MTDLFCSMYSDGLSSVTGKEGTWMEIDHQYAKTLTESTTMAGDTKLVCNVITFWYVLMQESAWTLNESGNLNHWGQRIIMLCLKSYCMRFEEHGVICAGDGRRFPFNPHQVMGVKNYTCKSRKQVTQWEMNRVRKTLAHQKHISWG